MKYFTFILLLPPVFAAEPAAAPRVYLEPQGGFESYIAAAIIKKHVPIVATDNQEDATYMLTSAVQGKEESAGSKIARCLFLYCAGIEGQQTATVKLVNRQQEVVWAYNVKKLGSQNFQSTAEAIAKHLKQYFETHPK